MSDENKPGGATGQGVMAVGQVVYLVPQETHHPVPEGVDFYALWRVAWAGKWMICAAVLAFSAIGVAYALLATPRYTAEVSLLQAETRTGQGLGGQLSQLGGLASLAGINLGGGSRVEPLAVLRSRGFASRFIQGNDLEKILLEDMWDAEKGKWKVGGERAPDIRDAVERLNKRVRRITEDRKSGLITLSIDWKDPVIAAGWANTMVKQINDQMREKALAESSTNVKYLQSELAAATEISLQQAIGRLLQQEMEKAMLARGNAEFAFRVIDPAQVPKRRSWPKRTLIALASAFLGGVAGLGYVVLRSGVLGRRRKSELVDRRFPAVPQP